MRALLVALSAANLTYIAVWRRLVLASEGERFWMRVPTRADALAAILNVLVLGALLYALLALAKRTRPGTRQAALESAPALALLIPLSTVFGGNGPVETFGHYGVWAVYALAFALGVFVLVRFRRQVQALLLIFAPFLLFTLGQAAWLAANPPQPVVKRAAEQAGSRRPPTRVVFIVFDELEQRLAFAERPPGLALPNFDRLRAESVAATRALPPGNGTHVSIPSLLTGRKVIAARPESAKELLIRFDGGKEPQRLTAEPHLFREAQPLGARAAVVGWHLPYCRVFGEYLAECFAQPRRDPEPSAQSVATAMLKQAQSLFYLLERKEHILEYETLMERARSAAANPEYDLVYLHLPVPHGPPIYEEGRLTITKFGKDWYASNLALADRALGELRQSMEAAGVWERSAVVMTSDHVWLLAHKYQGRRDEHVPLLVKLPERAAGAQYEAETSAIAAHGIVLGLLRGDVRSPADVAQKMGTR